MRAALANSMGVFYSNFDSRSDQALRLDSHHHLRHWPIVTTRRVVSPLSGVATEVYADGASLPAAGLRQSVVCLPVALAADGLKSR